MASRRRLAALVLSFAWPVASAADDPPPAVFATVTVRLAAGKTTYAVGELIPLELEFRGHQDEDYYFTVSDGRRLAGSQESYRATPAEGWDDPMAELLSVTGVAGSVLSSWHALDGQPLVVRSLLNDFVRFRQPGTYRIVVESQRLSRYSRRPAPVLVSAPLTLEIVPADPAWASAEAALATAALDGDDPAGRARAADTLRHLGTREAALALVARYDAGRDEALWWSAALASSPYRREIMDAMERRLEAGEPLPADFFRDLATLRVLGDVPPPERLEALEAGQCDATRRWIAAVGRRSPRAAMSVLLGSLEGASPASCSSGVPALLAAHPREAAEAFLGLRAELQSALLEWRFDLVGGRWIEPALEEVYARSKGDYRLVAPGDHALRRLGEIDPARGRALAIEEIRTGARGITANTLLAVVPEPVAGLDDALRARYAAARSDDARATAMWLVARHGSTALASFVRDRLALGVTCAEEAAAIAYLLEHDAPGGRRRLQPGLARPPGTCAIVPWTDLAPRAWDARVESAAIAHLERGDHRQVREAAPVLAAHGSTRAREALIARLERWSDEWRGHEREIEDAAASPDSHDSPATLGRLLVAALFDSRGFSLRPADVARIRAACLTDDCRQDVDAGADDRVSPGRGRTRRGASRTP